MLRRAAVLGIGLLASAGAQAGFLDELACPLFGCAGGPPPDAQLTCRTAGLVGQPDFNGGLPGAAAYRIRGNCSSGDHRQSVSYDVDASWTPSETDPARPNATEIFHITSNDSLSPDTRAQEGGAGYTEHVILSAHCDRDPWLYPASCQRIGDNLPESVHDTWSVPAARFPVTASAIDPVERNRLRSEYQARNGIEDDSVRERIGDQRIALAGAARFDDTSASARARHAGWRDAAGGASEGGDAASLRVRVRYPVALGYRDAHGLFDPEPTSCDAFHLSAVPDNASRDDRQPQLIKIAPRPGMRQDGGDYVCDYVISFLPLDTPIRVQAGIGTGRQRSTEAWQGGEQAVPTLGQYRTVLDDTRVLTLSAAQPRASLEFRMAYAGGIPNDGIAERVDGGRNAALMAALVAKPAAEPPICANARSARARNSPAAPSLERQCREAGGTPR